MKPKINKKDLRFQKAGDKIKKIAFFEIFKGARTPKIKVSKFCQKTKISPSTFYRHYQNLNQMSIQIEKEINDSFDYVISPKTPIIPLTSRILLKISFHKKFFQKAFLAKDFNLLYKVLHRAKFFPSTKSKNSILLEGQIIYLIYYWGVAENFNIDKISEVSKEIDLYLLKIKTEVERLESAKAG